jgi:phospholipid transport system substrate-binding protein
VIEPRPQRLVFAPEVLVRKVLVVLLLASTGALGAPSGGATAAVQASNDRVRAALQRYFDANGAAKEKARTDARTAVGALLDFDALAKATMGKHWSELTAQQRKRYTDALRGAMEANYLSKMEQGDVDLSKVHNQILGESTEGDRTIVKTKVQAGNDTASVDYALVRQPKGWRAVDVITEGVSLVDTYKDQVNKLLPKKGVDGVIAALERAKKRIEDEEAQRKTAAK